MAIEILLPRLGWTMEEGTFVEWLKRDGDPIVPGDVLYTVESDKSLNEVEAFDAGILRIPANSPAPGSKIPVGTVLAYIVQPGEEDGRPTMDSRPPTAASSHAPRSTPHVSRSTPDAVPAISPRARRIAAELRVDWTALTGSGRTGRIVERDVRAATTSLGDVKPIASTSRSKVNASPLAQRLAADLGVDLQQLAQAFPDKRIEREDVEQAVARRSATGTSEIPSAVVQGQPMSGLRRIVAERMAHSAHTSAPVTLHTEVDATELVRIREQLKGDAAKQNRDRSSVPSFNDLLAKIAAYALHEHPALNVRLDTDTIIQEPAVHIGIAVDSERGLLVVVLRDVHQRTLRQITAESQSLIQRARTGAATSADLQGSTFTITNLGMYDIDGFTPIINLPECAILGIGRIAPKQIVIDLALEKVAIRQMMTISLTFDHRLVDGAPAARFLQRIKQLIEQPYLWLM